MAMYACSPPRVLPCSPGRSRIKDAELFDDHAGAGLLHPTAGHRIRFGPNSNVNSYRLVSGTGANFRGCAREASVNSKKFATVALTSALAFGASSAVAQIDSRTNASTGTGVPTAAAGERSSSASPISGRVYIITKIPKNRLRRANSRSGRSRRMRVSGISPRRAAHPAKRRHHGFGFVPPVHLQAEQPQHGQPLELGLTNLGQQYCQGHSRISGFGALVRPRAADHRRFTVDGRLPPQPPLSTFWSRRDSWKAYGSSSNRDRPYGVVG
jgi:hypothetical protein